MNEQMEMFVIKIHIRSEQTTELPAIKFYEEMMEAGKKILDLIGETMSFDVDPCSHWKGLVIIVIQKKIEAVSRLEARKEAVGVAKLVESIIPVTQFHVDFVQEKEKFPWIEDD